MDTHKRTHLNKFHLRLALFLSLSKSILSPQKYCACGHYLREGRDPAEREGHRVPDRLSFTKWPCYFCVQEMR